MHYQITLYQGDRGWTVLYPRLDRDTGKLGENLSFFYHDLSMAINVVRSVKRLYTYKDLPVVIKPDNGDEPYVLRDDNDFVAALLTHG
jgi:hypothetical protein